MSETRFTCLLRVTINRGRRLPKTEMSDQSSRAPSLLFDVVHQEAKDALVLLPSLVNATWRQLKRVTVYQHQLYSNMKSSHQTNTCYMISPRRLWLKNKLYWQCEVKIKSTYHYFITHLYQQNHTKIKLNTDVFCVPNLWLKQVQILLPDRSNGQRVCALSAWLFPQIWPDHHHWTCREHRLDTHTHDCKQLNFDYFNLRILDFPSVRHHSGHLATLQQISNNIHRFCCWII